jgi:hypothetical protein
LGTLGCPAQVPWIPAPLFGAAFFLARINSDLHRPEEKPVPYIVYYVAATSVPS